MQAKGIVKNTHC